MKKLLKIIILLLEEISDKLDNKEKSNKSVPDPPGTGDDG